MKTFPSARFRYAVAAVLLVLAAFNFARGVSDHDGLYLAGGASQVGLAYVLIVIQRPSR